MTDALNWCDARRTYADQFGEIVRFWVADMPTLEPTLKRKRTRRMSDHDERAAIDKWSDARLVMEQSEWFKLAENRYVPRQPHDHNRKEKQQQNFRSKPK